MFKVYERESFTCLSFMRRVPASRYLSLVVRHDDKNIIPGMHLRDTRAPVSTPLRRVAFLQPRISSTCLARKQCTFTGRSMSSETSLLPFIARPVPVGSCIREGCAGKERECFRDSFWRSFLTVMQITCKVFTDVPEQWNYLIDCYRVKDCYHST